MESSEELRADLFLKPARLSDDERTAVLRYLKAALAKQSEHGDRLRDFGRRQPTGCFRAQLCGHTVPSREMQALPGGYQAHAQNVDNNLVTWIIEDLNKAHSEAEAAVGAPLRVKSYFRDGSIGCNNTYGDPLNLG